MTVLQIITYVVVVLTLASTCAIVVFCACSASKNEGPLTTGHIGCDYQGREFGAGSYPDSVCLGGYLWDADSGRDTADGLEFTSGGDLPCPQCNLVAWRKYHRDSVVGDAIDRLSRRRSPFMRSKGGAWWGFRLQLLGVLQFVGFWLAEHACQLFDRLTRGSRS